MNSHLQFKLCGESRIRTYEDISQQSYSLPQLAALVSPRFLKELFAFSGYKYRGFSMKSKETGKKY